MSEIIEQIDKMLNPGSGRGAPTSRDVPVHRMISEADFCRRFKKKDVLDMHRATKTRLSKDKSEAVANYAAMQRVLASTVVLTPSRLPVISRYGDRRMTQRTGTQIVNGWIDRRRAKFAGASLAILAVAGPTIGNSLQGGNNTAKAEALVVGSAVSGQPPAEKAPKAAANTPKTPNTIAFAAGKIVCSNHNPVNVTVTSADKIGSGYSPLAAIERSTAGKQGAGFSPTHLPSAVANQFWNELSAMDSLPSAQVALNDTFPAPVGCITK